VFTSEFIPAKRAYDMGLVTEVYPTADLHTKVIEIAK
jgi:enoyl-CoA hydratase/carnithine racemase